MKRLIRLIVLCLWLPVVAGLAGCPFMTDTGEKPDVPTPPKFEARTSPENLLSNLKTSYEERELAEYESLLATDFTFFYEDAQTHIPDSWSRQEEIDIHENMFDSDYVQTLRLDFDYGAVILDTLKSTPQDSLWEMTITNVDLYLFGTSPGFPDEAPQKYEMEDGIQRFWFRKNPWKDPGANEYVWTIVEWQEVIE